MMRQKVRRSRSYTPASSNQVGQNAGDENKSSNMQRSRSESAEFTAALQQHPAYLWGKNIFGALSILFYLHESIDYIMLMMMIVQSRFKCNQK